MMAADELKTIFREAKELRFEIFWPCRIVGELERKLGREPTFDEFAKVVEKLPKTFTLENIQEAVHGKVVGKPSGILVAENIQKAIEVL